MVATTTTTASSLSSDAAASTPLSLNEEEPSTKCSSHHPTDDSCEAPSTTNDDITPNNHPHHLIMTEPPSSNSSSSQDIGLSLSSIDADHASGANSLHEELNLVVTTQRGTITSSSESCNIDDNDNNHDGGSAVPLPNPDGLPRPILLTAVVPTDDNNSAVVATTKNDDTDQQTHHHNHEQQPSSSQLSREEQLEHRIFHLEQSLQELSQFCQTILLNQQRQQQQQIFQQQQQQLDQSDEEPTTPTTKEQLKNQWHPSTTQYAPLDSPDASLNNNRYRRLTTSDDDGSHDGGTNEEGSREEEDTRNNMQMNSLSVKLGVTPYNNMNKNSMAGGANKNNKKKGRGGGSGSGSKKGGGDLDPHKKTMSMLFLDIEPGQSRGPNLITLDPVAADDDDGDDVVVNENNDDDDAAAAGDNDGGGWSNSSSSGSSNGDGSSRSGSGGEEDDRERGVSKNANDDEKKKKEEEEGGRTSGGDDVVDHKLLDSPSSSSPPPSLHHQLSHSSPTLTTVTEKSVETAEEGGEAQYSSKEDTSSSLPTSQVLSPSRRSGLSSSFKINRPHHHHHHHHHVAVKTEESLECQAYTSSHLEELRLRREMGKGRAYSCNDAIVSPPRSSRKGGGGGKEREQLLPTVTSPVWKPSFEALNCKDGEGGEKKSSITEITVDTSGPNDASGSSGVKDISTIPQLIMPDLNDRVDDEKMIIEEGVGVIVVNVPTKRKESCGSASSSVPPSTSCASNMSSDTTKTPKSSGNVIKREVRANSITSNKERSQSVSSSKSKDSSSGVVTTAVAIANPTDTSNEALPSNKKDKKSESKTSSQQQQHPSDSGKNKTMSEYVINDLLNIDSRNHDGSATEDIDANMEEFLRIPSKFEYLMLFSLAVCVDSFLYPWAMLPLKFIWGLVCLACTIYKMIQKKKWRLNPDEADVHGIGFHRRHLYAILQSLLIWLVYSQILCPISIGKLYHWIRGQAMLKLYVLISIVEVFDRLLCSFGQDAWDSLYWNTTRRPRHPRLFVSIIVVGVYVTIHSLFLFVHVATLSVAVNSADNALLTLLISGNFAEIKTTVFKKYNKQNLFKITTSDICERFKLALFLLLILILNRFQGEMTSSMVNDYYFMCGIVFAAELVSDWIKHSFITKFNFIKSTAYFDYALVLSGDVTGIGHEGLSLDYTHAAVKRLGLAQIPLVCVTARYLHEAVRFAIAFQGNGDVDHPFTALVDLMADGSKWKFYIGLLKCMGACSEEEEETVALRGEYLSNINLRQSWRMTKIIYLVTISRDYGGTAF